jgi:hypothetical protein
MLRESTGKIPIRRHEHGRTWQRARQHQRLVAGPGQIAAHPFWIADHDDAVFRPRSTVPSAEDRGTLPDVQQFANDRSDQRSLPATSNREVADADDRPAQPASQLGPTAVALTSSSSNRGVKMADHCSRLAIGGVAVPA